MPTLFTRSEITRLTQILESLNETIDAAAQRQLMTRAFRFLARGNEIASRLRYSTAPHTFAVGVIDDLPTCSELIQRIIDEAEAVLKDLAS